MAQATGGLKSRIISWAMKKMMANAGGAPGACGGPPPWVKAMLAGGPPGAGGPAGAGGSMAAALAIWMQSVGDPKMATRSLTAIVHQRLMRNLCPNCKSGFTPAPEQAKKLGIPAGKQVELFRPSGKVQVKNRIEDCPVCRGTAYFGQEGIFEVLALDDEGRRLIAENDFRSAYARAVREQKMIQLQESALLKVRKGSTSLEEVQRVFAPKQAPAQAKAAPAQQG